MSRKKTSAVLSITLPPEAIKEFFDGLAKVESAKHAPTSSFDWSSLLSMASILLPIISSYSKSSEQCSNVRVPEQHASSQCPVSPCSESGTAHVEIKERQNGSSPEIVVSFAPKETKTETLEVECSKESCDESKETTDTEVPKKSETTVKPKRPVYQDGDNVVLDINSLSGAFSGANGAGGIADMMKMFSPLMEGLMGGMNGMNPLMKPEATSDTTKSVKSSETEAEKVTPKDEVSSDHTAIESEATVSEK